PRHGKRQKQRVQTRIVESLTNVLAGREDNSPFVARDVGETVIHRLALLLAHAGAQDDDVLNPRREFVFESVEVLISLCQTQGRAPIPNAVEKVLTDASGKRLVVYQLLIERLKFDALVRIRVSRRLEGCRLNQDEVFERPRSCLCSRIFLMSNRAAL